MGNNEVDDEVDEVDPEVRRLIGLLAMDLRRRTIHSLLSGNDTQCFTVEQYKRAYVRIAHPSKPVFDPWYHVDPAMHLKSCSELVTEVAPGVWAVRSDVK